MALGDPWSSPAASLIAALRLGPSRLRSSAAPVSVIPASPQLPLELLEAILELCDISTLATTSRVSFAFLKTSSRRLYTHTELHGVERVVKLLDGKREQELSSPSSLVSPFLALTQIKTVSFFCDATSKQGTATSWDGSRLRLVRERLPVQTFTAYLSRWVTRDVPGTSDGLRNLIRDEAAVMGLFSPLVYRVFGPLSPPPPLDTSKPAVWVLAVRPRFLWTRLKRVVLIDAYIPDLLSPGLLNLPSFTTIRIRHEAGWVRNRALASLSPADDLAFDVGAMLGKTSAWTRRLRVKIQVETEAERHGVLALLAGDPAGPLRSKVLTVIARQPAADRPGPV